MPADHTSDPTAGAGARITEDDLDAALDAIRERAEKLEFDDEIYALLMIETAEHFHQHLMNEC